MLRSLQSSLAIYGPEKYEKTNKKNVICPYAEVYDVQRGSMLVNVN